jgi:putative hydrolase of the HAD superfamily
MDGISCVLFDLYGTLVDIRTDEEGPALWQAMAWCLSLRGRAWEAEALKKAYREACSRAENDLRSQTEYPEIDIVPIWEELAETDADGARELAVFFRSLSLRKLRLFPGAKEVLDGLRAMGRTVVLLSNAQAAFTRPELRLLGIDRCFDHIFLSGEAGVKKPAPAFFRLPERVGIDLKSCLMVGNDDVCDCAGAAAVGMRSLYLHTEQSPPRPARLPAGCREIRDIREVLDPHLILFS